MRTTLYNIKIFSECPAYYKFMQDVYRKNISSNLYTIQSVMKKCYAVTLETSFKVTWRRIVGYVDELVFKDVDIQDDKSFEAAKTIAEHHLAFLRRWYEDIYMIENVLGYSNLKIEQPIGSNIIEDELFIIKLSEDKPIIMILDDVARTDTQLYNDISIRGLSWLVYKTLDCDEVGIEYMSIGKQGGFTLSKLSIDKVSQKRTQKVLYQLVRSMAAGVNYPSVTQKCNECPFRRKCRL